MIDIDRTALLVKGEEGRETTKLFTKLNTWEKDRRFYVIMKLSENYSYKEVHEKCMV